MQSVQSDARSRISSSTARDVAAATIRSVAGAYKAPGPGARRRLRLPSGRAPSRCQGGPGSNSEPTAPSSPGPMTAYALPRGHLAHLGLSIACEHLAGAQFEFDFQASIDRV